MLSERYVVLLFYYVYLEMLLVALGGTSLFEVGLTQIMWVYVTTSYILTKKNKKTNSNVYMMLYVPS